jgi:hypothetical protein
MDASEVFGLEAEIKDLLSGHRLSQDQLRALQQGESDADTIRSLQRMLANTQNALLRLAREIDELRAGQVGRAPAAVERNNLADSAA